jgi:hypothetical protein
VRECKPQSGGCDTDEEFGHRQPPLRPLAVSLGCAPAYQVPQLRFGSRQSGELFTPRLPDHGPNKVFYIRDTMICVTSVASTAARLATAITTAGLPHRFRSG